MNHDPDDVTPQGRFTNKWLPLPHPVPCRHCGIVGWVYYRNWESNCGGYDDAKFECGACGEVWWVEGPDA